MNISYTIPMPRPGFGVPMAMPVSPKIGLFKVQASGSPQVIAAVAGTDAASTAVSTQARVRSARPGASSPVRMAVIGVGALGRHHARILSTLPGVKLVGVVDPNEQQGQAVAQSAGCSWSADYRALLGSIDAATIVVPTFLHCEVGSELIRQGKHVLIEKPLASTVTEGEGLCALAKEHNVTLQVGHIERFNPAYRKLADWTAAPKYIRAERLSPYPFRSLDIGVVLDLMIHDIDLVLGLTGELPSRVEAFGVSLVGGHEDCAQARFHFPGGCIADIAVNRVSPNVCRSLQVWSASGCATADLQSRSVTCYGPGLPLQQGRLPYELARDQAVPVAQMKDEMFGKYVNVETHQASNEDALTAELTDFVQAVRTGDLPRVDGTAGLNALRVAHAVLSRIATHHWDHDEDGAYGQAALIEQVAQRSDAARRAA